MVEAFAVVFLLVGIALFFLLQSSNKSAATERKDVKSFNVAEAGVDSAIVALRATWPNRSGQTVTVDPDTFRGYYDEKEFPDPSGERQFIHAITYDDTPDNPTSVVANRVAYDSNDNNIMWIDSEAIVDNARHRILVQVERLAMPLDIPDIALLADKAGGNGQGLSVSVDPNYTGSIPVDPTTGDVGAAVRYTGYQPDLKKDVNLGANIRKVTEPECSFYDVLPEWKFDLLKQMAQPDGYFDDADHATGDLVDFLCDPTRAPGSIVYFETTANGVIQIAGNNAMGSPEEPLLLVVDARNATDPVIDWRGTSDFHGVLIVIGNVLLRGNNGVTGCVFSSGLVENKGGPGVFYNGDYIRWINQKHTLSVAIVPNTWEEYTTPQ
jgi:hypothetical protein